MKILKNQDGQAMIYATLFLVVLGLLFIGLAVDIGMMTVVRNWGQAAVDASALAGTSGIPTGEDEVSSRATGLNDENTVLNSGAGIADSNIEFCTTPADCTSEWPAGGPGGIRVTKTYNAPVAFARLIEGGSSTTTTKPITVSATGWIGGISEGEPDIPIALRSCQINFPTSCDTPRIIQSPETTDNSAWTTFSNTGGNWCGDYADGSEDIPKAEVGDTINLVGSGQVSSCLQKLKDRYCTVTTGNQNCNPPTGTWPNLLVPIIDCDGNQSTGTILGFATISITEVQAPPDVKVISTLQCNVTASGPPGGVFAGTYSDQAVLVK